MTVVLPFRRPRGLRRAPKALQRLAAAQAATRTARVTLEAAPAADRALMALLVLERLTPAETAAALGLDARDVERRRRAVLARVRRSLRVLAPTSRAGEVAGIVTLPKAKEA